MKLSVIIVNYNVKYFLELCLESLYRAADSIHLEVFVVDNASEDDSIKYLKKRFPKVQYISNSENVGFSKANNQAIKQSKGEYVLLLNPDVVLAEDTLTECIKFMDNHPQSGGVGVKMINGSGEFLPESKRGIPTLLSSFLYLSGLNKILPNNRFFCRYQLNHLDKDEAHQVAVLAGAFMMIRKAALDKCGLLDEDYFMYGEDIDLSCRIVKAGFKNYYLPLPIIHFKGESASQISHIDRCNFFESMFIFFKKYGGNNLRLLKLIVKFVLYCQYYISVLDLKLEKRLAIVKVKWAKFKLNLIKNYRINLHRTSNEPILFFGSEKSYNKLCAKYKNAYISLLGFELNESEDSMFRAQLTYNYSKDSVRSKYIVFCYDDFSFKGIIHYLLLVSRMDYQIGFCSKETDVIVTPQNIIENE